MYDLPLFPLHTVLFPGMPVQLHIFEQRYRLMIRTCLDDKRPFGVVLIRQGVEAFGLAVPYLVGCTARIVEFEPLDDGRMNLTAVGEERFRILETKTDLPYLTGEVESFPLENHHTLDVLRGIRPLRRRLSAYIRLLAGTGDTELDLTGLQMPDDSLTFLFLAASLLQLPAVEKQPLLAAENAGSLYRMVNRLYLRELAVLSRLIPVKEEDATRAAWLN